MTTTTTSEILIRSEGCAGRITLNRPKQLNALTYEQVLAITTAIEAWRNDTNVTCVILDGAGERGLCAGGDVRAMYDARQHGSKFARHFWADEYRLNASIHRYPKPFVAIMDGIVMGGGIGLSAHASHRIVTERSQLAMPETTIGMIPDVGGTWLLSRKVKAPGLSQETGTYLALTGNRFNGTEAVALDLANVCILSKHLPAVLVEMQNGEPPDSVMIRYNSAQDEIPPLRFLDSAPAISQAFGCEGVEDILSLLELGSSVWARETHNTLRQKSPLALKLTLAALRQARSLPTLEAALEIEYRLAVRLYEHGELNEGVRALLVDKDKAPKWNPPTLAEVTPAMVESFMRPLPAGEDLTLT